MKKYRIALPIFALWLVGWIVMSWPAIQDDALIHLRYAQNLRQFHFITYDGVHPDFGASSLLYVGLLSAASALTRSPELPRLISSIVHIALFCGLAWLFVTRTAAPAGRSSGLSQISSLILLALLVAPCSTRWLDDGMETGIGLCVTSCLAWLAFDESRRATTTNARFLGLLVLGYFLVLLRTELAMLAGIAFLAIVAGRIQRSGQRGLRNIIRVAIRASHLLIGCALACAMIRLKMGVLLPDTAVAKAKGLHAWHEVLVATAAVLIGSFSVGVGFLLFWILTFAIVLLRRRADAATVVANTVFVVLLFLTTIRGQAVQGVRYLLWALLFPAVWNILLLAGLDDREGRHARLSARLLYVFAVLLLIDLPLESKVMYRVLTDRAKTMREFESQHLDQMVGMRGVAMDIGYIGYFAKAKICDVSGLVNGRAVARLKPEVRAKRCADEHPEFAFGNSSQLAYFSDYLDMRDWRICGAYDFVNVRTQDTHLLVAPSASAERICRAAGAVPGSDAALETLLPSLRSNSNNISEPR